MAAPLPDDPESLQSRSLGIALQQEQTTVATDEISKRPARALLAWVDDIEAINLLLGRTLAPNDDIAALRQIVSAFRMRAAARSPFSDVDPIQDMTDQRLAATISERTDIQAAFGGLQWRPALVNLKEVLSFQKTVNIDGLKERIEPAIGDTGALMDLCLPTDQPLPPQAALLDPDQKGITVSSLNPNLRLLGTNLHQAQMSMNSFSLPIQVQAVTFFFSVGTSYLSVSQYQGRCFVRDGYHRAAGLLHAGIQVVPCILVEARTFSEVGCPPGSLPYEVIFGTRPPRVADFWDDEVAQTVMQPAIRKGIRFRGDEFVVPR